MEYVSSAQRSRWKKKMNTQSFEYSRKVAMTLALVLFAMAAAGVQVATAQNSPQDFVDLHNAARAAVNVEEVTWDATVAAYAQSYADQRSGDCAPQHSPGAGSTYGENIFVGGAGKAWSATDAVGSWMDEKQSYDYASNTCSLGALINCGHYTQIVWRSSTAIGCARVDCNNGGVFITCNYNPPGNDPNQRPY